MMKGLIVTILMMMSWGIATAQLEFSIDGQLVDQTQTQYTYLDTGQFVAIDCDMENIGMDTLSLTGWVCMVLDDPNIEMTIHEVGIQNDPFGGVHGPVYFDTSDCWPGAHYEFFYFDITPGDIFSLRTYFNVHGNGCERFRYKIFNNGSALDSITIETCSTLGIDARNLENVSFYPSPSNGEFTMENTENAEVVLITNALGQSVEFSRESDHLYLHEPEPGCYFLTVTTQQGAVHIRRLVVQ